MSYLSKNFMVRVFAGIFLLLSVAGCNSQQEKSKKAPLAERVEVLATTTLLANIEDDLKSGIDPGQPAPVPLVQNLFKIDFNDRGRGIAYIAETGGKVRVVHNGKAGRPYQSIGAMALSPDGRRVAYSALSEDKVRMVIDGLEGATAETILKPVFSPDSRHITYEVKNGGLWRHVVDGKESAPCKNGYVYHDEFFSSDSSKLISIESPMEMNGGPLRVLITNLAFKGVSVKEIQGNDFLFNNDKTRLAVIGESNGKKRMVEIDLNHPDAVAKEGPLYDTILRHSFGADGVSVAYVAERGGERFLVLNGKEEQVPKSGKIESLAVPFAKGGAGLILSSSDGHSLYQTLSGSIVKEKTYEVASSLVYNRDGSRHAYVAKKGKKIFAVVNGKEGPAFDMVVSPMFSPDNRFLVYRARKDGKRFAVVADAEGKLISQHQSYEMVYPVVFTNDGKSVAYGVKDGNKLIWKVEKL